MTVLDEPIDGEARQKSHALEPNPLKGHGEAIRVSDEWTVRVFVQPEAEEPEELGRIVSLVENGARRCGPITRLTHAHKWGSE